MNSGHDHFSNFARRFLAEQRDETSESVENKKKMLEFSASRV